MHGGKPPDGQKLELRQATLSRSCLNVLTICSTNKRGGWPGAAVGDPAVSGADSLARAFAGRAFAGAAVAGAAVAGAAVAAAAVAAAAVAAAAVAGPPVAGPPDRWPAGRWPGGWWGTAVGGTTSLPWRLPAGRLL